MNQIEAVPMDDPLWVIVVTRIISSIWLGTCIIPNAIIIRRISNGELYRTKHFYFILVHLSWGNLLQMIYYVYNLFVTEEYQSDPKTFIFLVFHLSTTQMQIQHALFFTIDKYVNSKKFCRTNIKSNWTMHSFGLLIITIMMMHEILDIFDFSKGFIVISSIILGGYLIRFVVYLIKGTTEENYKIRLAISGVCIFTNYLYVVWVILDKFVELDGSIAFSIAAFVVHSTGWFNLTLLNYHDPNVDVRLNIKQNFQKLKCKFRKWFKKDKNSSPPELEGYLSTTTEDTVLPTCNPPSYINNLSPIFIPKLIHDNGKALEVIEPTTSHDNAAFLRNDSFAGNKSPIFSTRSRQEQSISII